MVQPKAAIISQTFTFFKGNTSSNECHSIKELRIFVGSGIYIQIKRNWSKALKLFTKNNELISLIILYWLYF